MEITREKLVATWGLTNRLLTTKTGVKFHYMLLKNKKIMEPEITALQELQTKSQTPPDGFDEFDEKRIALCKDCSDSDENGDPILINNNYQIAEDRKPEFESKLSDLQEEYKEVLGELENRQKEFNDLMRDTVDINFVTFGLSIVPEQIIGTDLELLFDLIDEDL